MQSHKKMTSVIHLCILGIISLGFVVTDEYHPYPHFTEQDVRQAQHRVNEDASYWNRVGQQLLLNELGKERINRQAKNVILFLGDGMSIATVTAARIYKGQKQGKSGEEEQLAFERFPYTALAKTYCTDAQVADSACTATAYLTGVKTDTDIIGLDANVEFRNCDTQNNPAFHVDSVMTWAQRASKGTGIVTTTRVTHATPAGSYAHAANRDWEDDLAVALDGADPDTCDDIAEQLVLSDPGRNFKVVLGGGRSYFTPAAVQDPETGARGRRRDGKNLVDQWLNDHPDGVYITHRDQLLALDPDQASPVFGLFSPSHMEYFAQSAGAENPTLAEMTRFAISKLQAETNGFVLLVEGGRIDQAHHDGLAKIALEEAVQFDSAIETAYNMTDPNETLIIVTADHSHTMTINGYPVRGNDILGLTGELAGDLKPYTTLSYANGPGFTSAFSQGNRVDLTGVDTTADDFKQPAMVPLASETHGGDDVAIFASGPQAHLFQGVYEQNYIAHVMGYAACIGPGVKFCDAPRHLYPRK